MTEYLTILTIGSLCLSGAVFATAFVAVKIGFVTFEESTTINKDKQND